MFRIFSKTKREIDLQRQVDDLKAELAAKDRIIAVKDREIDELAAVVERNHQRVKTETALTLRQRAEHEGMILGRPD